MADNTIRKYRVGGALLRRALLEGFSPESGGILRGESGRRSALLPGLDSATPGCAWGRLSLKFRLGPEAVLRVRFFASDMDEVIQRDETVKINDLLLDASVPMSEKERLFMLAGGVEKTGSGDILLDGQEGRWLWLWLEVDGEGEAVLEDIRVYVPGDNFFATLPQVYRTDNDFLRRYLSIFSTMYNEFQEKLDDLPALLDVDTAPEAMLPVLAHWLGLEIDETLFTPEELRTLLRAAPALLERKGSRWAVENAVRLFVTEPVYVVERNLLTPEQRRREELYGSTPFDFTVMLKCKTDEKLRLRLRFLVDQFKPLRSRCRIVFLEDCGGMDAFTYLDVNGTVLQSRPGNLDDGEALTGMTYLQ